MSEHDTAFHEAGHVIVGLFLGLPLESVTLDTDDPDAAGVVKWRPAPEWFEPCSWLAMDSRTRDRAEAEIMMGFAGMLVSEHSGEDVDGAFVGFGMHPLGTPVANTGEDITHVIVRGGDAGRIFGLVDMMAMGPGEEDPYIEWLRARASNLLVVLWKDVELVAAELMKHRTLSGRRVRAFLRARRADG